MCNSQSPESPHSMYQESDQLGCPAGWQERCDCCDLTAVQSSCLVHHCPCVQTGPVNGTPVPGRDFKLAVQLVFEKRKGPSSHLHGYIAHLPQSFDLPMTWSDQELADLQYPFLLDMVCLLSPGDMAAVYAYGL